MARSNAQKHVNGANRVMSVAQLEAQADHVAVRVLGVPSRREAFRKLDRGDLVGTAVEAELKMLRRLIDHE